MPRKARIDAPGALHHIMIRGIERKAIFRDALDRSDFLKRLGKILSQTHTPCFAWTLMPNHVHLLLRTGPTPLATVMRRLLTGYAQHFNRRHRRHGHLFQNRYKSVLCEEEPYFLELIRYIHLNPLRQKIVADVAALKTYPDCGHSAIMGKTQYPWQDVNAVLERFGQKRADARRAYAAFVAKGIALGPRPDLTGGGLIRSAGGWAALASMRSRASRIMGDERILGGGDFVAAVLQRAGEDFEQKTFVQSQGLTFDEVLQRVADHFGIHAESMAGACKQRRISRARACACHLSVEKLNMNGRTVARKLQLSPSAVSKAVLRGRADPENDGIWKAILASLGESTPLKSDF